ncbi:MAG: TIGR03013 family PEP-CTERM/XrtA system glycosyltransferase [Nitrospirae bacterium]|nr:TIGR03013 family PEP-CTERM/XrtA system glycosyltransferase [Nitrospirota bacterium]
MNFLRNHLASKSAFLIGGDIIISFAAVYAGIFQRFMGGPPQVLSTYDPLIPRALTFSIIVVFMCFLVDLYDDDNITDKKEVFLRITLANFLAFLALGAFYYFIPYVQIGRGILIFSIVYSILLQAVWHVGYVMVLRLPVVAKKVLIIGTGPVAETMGNLLLSNNNGFALAGYINCTDEPIHVPKDYVIGNGDGLLSIASKEKVQKIVVSLSERRGAFPVREVLNCKLQGIDIIDGPSFYEQMTGKLLIENMNPSHLIFSDGFRVTPFWRYIKRLFDVFFAISGIVLSLPFLLIIPALIKLGSKGPVLFRQKRVGEGERHFTLYKFRTMIQDAEKNTGPVWSQAGDKRITKVGKLLRKTRLDELPQLFNVVRGEMSFIGPRPERPFFVESLKKQIPYYSERHCTKPGVTGWAQVKYEYGDSMEDAIEKLRYDLYYIKYQSFSIDMLIILNTVKVIIFGRGGR